MADLQDAADVLRPVFDEHGDGFVSFEVMPGYANDTDAHARAGARLLGAAGPPERDDQDPRHRGGRARRSSRRSTRASTSTSRCCSASSSTRRSPRPTSAGSSAAPAEGLPLNVALGRELLRLARGHRGRQAPRGARPQRPRRHGGARQRARRLRALRGDLPRRALRRAARRRRARCSGRCGPRPGPRTPPTPRRSTSTGWSRPDTVNTMPMKTLLAVAERGEIEPGSARARRRAPSWPRSPPPGSTWTTSSTTLLAGRHRGVRDADGQAARGDRERRARRSSPGRPQAIAAVDRRAALGGDRGARRDGRARGRRAARVGQGRVAVGRPGRRRDRRPARLADDLRRDARARRRARRVRARRAPPTGFTDAVLLGMGGSSLAPGGALADLRRAGGGARPARARLDRPGGDPRGRASRSTSSTRSSSSRPSRAARSRRCRCSSTSTRWSATAATSSRSPTPAARCSSSPASTASAPTFENDPNIGGRYSALSLFGLVPAALIGAPIHALLERAAAAEQACAHFDSTESNPGLWLGLALGELARARPRQADLRRRRAGLELRPVGRAARRREHRQAGPRHPAGRRRAAARARRLRRTTACSSTCATRRCADADTDARVEALGARRAPDDHAHRRRQPRTSGGMFFLAEFATAVAGWVLEINPFDQPNVAGGQGRDQARARGRAAARAAARRRRRAARAARRRRARLLHRRDGLPRAVGRVRRGGRRAARDADGAHDARDDVRLRPALPALDGPAPQGRAADRPLPVADRRRGAGRRDPRRRLLVPHAQDRAGARRPQTLRAHGLPAEIVRLEGDPAAALRDAPHVQASRRCADADRLRRARQDGRQHGRADPPRLRPRGRRLRLRRAGGRAREADRRDRRRRACARWSRRSSRRARSGSWCPPATRRRRRSRRSPS